MQKQILLILLMISSTIHPVKTLKELAERAIVSNSKCLGHVHEVPRKIAQAVIQSAIDQLPEYVDETKGIKDLKCVIETIVHCLAINDPDESKVYNEDQHYEDLRSIIKVLEKSYEIAEFKFIEEGSPHCRPFEPSPVYKAVLKANKMLGNISRDTLVKLFSTKLDKDRLQGNCAVLGVLFNRVILSNPEILRLVLKAGLDINIKNDQGLTPLDYAKNLGLGRVMDDIESLGGKMSIVREADERERSLETRYFLL